MTAPAREPRDLIERKRIRTELATNMLVEAGAGSGKTTSLVARLLEHVRTGTPVERIAAVTFTRKAANELRERFQVELEKAVRGASDEVERARYERALRELDRAFLGTIHSFCARLLRERPLEVGLDPSFQEVSDEDWQELRQRFWRRWIERARREGDADVAALQRVGLDVRSLADAFEQVMLYMDVEFPLADAPLPDAGPCRRELERLMADARRLMPRDEPANGWDPLMGLVRRLEFRRSLGDFASVAGFCTLAGTISASACAVTQERWAGKPRAKSPEAKALSEAFVKLLQGPLADLLRCWREHRYPFVMRVLRRAAGEFARERHDTGQLGFEDLLLLAAKLLREHPSVRAELGARWAHLLVDEFQDTDPVQAEVCFLLASDPSEGSDWRRVTPRPGSLFVVGDPKQSIYRFRRADIQVYEIVKRRMQACGAVLALTTNFRSVSSIEALVNAHFAGVFPAKATPEQAPFSPMETVREPEGSDGVYRYVVRPDGRRKDGIVELDAALVASWIAQRVASGERKPGDFLILTATKYPIESYARALAERNVPVSTTGAQLPQEHELRELLVVLRAIADPDDAVAVVAALEGLFFGLTPADLFDASRAGLHFAITHRPNDESHRVGRALMQLHLWWQAAQRHPADVLLERILSDTGLILHAASSPLGEARAGALLHLVEALRLSSLDSALGAAGAIERIELLLEAEAPDAPLRPGRTDAVRIMNLHKAKGLEANVVILAAPTDASEHEPEAHVSRADGATATGGLRIGYKEGRTFVTLAQPPGWDAMQQAEQRFADAERARLLYVAATRARRELVVSQAEIPRKDGSRPDASTWRPLERALEEHSFPLALVVTEPAGRRRLERTPESLAAAVREAGERVERATAPSFHIRTVTELAKARDDAPAPDGVPARRPGLGAAWGSAVHRGIEALGRGRRGDSLRAFALAVARDEGLDDAQGADLAELLERVERSEEWRALAAHGTPMLELPVMRVVGGDGEVTITEGVVDAASLGDDGWRIVDWKSDRVHDAEWEKRRVQYERQVATYCEMLAELTGRPAAGSIARVG